MGSASHPQALAAEASPLGRASQPAPRLQSLFRYSPGLILVAIAIADSSRLIDPDLWGHLRFGQAILMHHGPVLRDPYSYSAFGHLWIDYEWLGQAVMAALFNHGGLFALLVMKLACSCAIVIFLALALAETGASTLVQFGVLVFAATVIKPQLQFRPQSFTLVMEAVVFWMLARRTYRRSGRLWLVVPILALWANLHAGFIAGIAALGIYSVVSGVQDFFAGRGYRRTLVLASITIASALATLATPYGVSGWEAAIRTMRNPLTVNITEWQPLLSTMIAAWRELGIHVSNQEVGVAMMAALAVSWWMSPGGEDLALVAVGVAFSVSAFMAQRNLPVAVIALAAPLARHMHLALTRRWQPRAPTAVSSRLWWTNQIALVAISIVLCIHSGLFASHLTSSDPYPVSACDFMQRNGLKGNILNKFEWGEYLIWRMAPGSKVLVDGRYDTVYPLKVFAGYTLFRFDLPHGDWILSAYPPDYILIGANSAARHIVDPHREWKLIYQDSAARLYARSDSAAARLPGLPRRGIARAVQFP
jgi:hypothetical protein